MIFSKEIESFQKNPKGNVLRTIAVFKIHFF